MGDWADDILDGLVDEFTGEYIDGEAPGYPRSSRNNCKPKIYNDFNSRVTKLVKQIWAGKWQHIYDTVMKYGTEVGHADKNFSRVCANICSGTDRTEWNKFKKWLQLQRKEAIK